MKASRKRNVAREARQRELHAIRIAQPREKRRRQSAAHSESAEGAALRALEFLVNALTPASEEDFLRRAGFVSQNAGQSQGE